MLDNYQLLIYNVIMINNQISAETKMIDRINEIENKRFHACQMYDYWMKQSCKKSANLWQKIAREYKTELDQLYAELEAATK